jgi:hypothetical protein
MSDPIRLTLGALVVAVMAAACGSHQMQTVADARWRTVPAAERAAIEKQHGEELTRAKADVDKAQAQLAEARHAAATKAAANRTGATSASATRALARVEAAKAAWLEATIAWRERRLDAAQAHVTAVECQRELDRAQAVYGHTRDDDPFDPEAYRGQHARAQETWFVAEAKAVDARSEVDQRSGAMTEAKDAYAQLVHDELEAAQEAAMAERPPPKHFRHLGGF